MKLKSSATTNGGRDAYEKTTRKISKRNHETTPKRNKITSRVEQNSRQQGQKVQQFLLGQWRPNSDFKR